ncbi:hypothetical protein NC652_011958 [Populus alba x Populus x berolinensis]|nr:hypothetical protein NC652_011958 [Populus alba x Populus x berolinensis]
MAEAEELPKAIVCRMVKDALSRCYPDESESPHFHPLSFRHGCKTMLHFAASWHIQVWCDQLDGGEGARLNSEISIVRDN